jgi:hypothetical protein
MIAFIQSQIFFYFAILAVIFLPGYFLSLAVSGRKTNLSLLEKFVIAPGLSIITVDFISFAYDRLRIQINSLSMIFGIGLFCAVCFGIFKYGKKVKDESPDQNPIAESASKNKKRALFDFSKNQLALILCLVFLIIFIKVAYLQDSIAPTSTDMGHHMYWTKWISDNHKLPDYEGMPDFIIGEHIPFAVIGMISGADYFSGFPVIILLLIDILGILAVFILTLRIFGNNNVAILILLFLGVLYAVSSPQAKYVSGGVIGNVFGNYLLPLAFYFYYRAFEFMDRSSTSIMEIELSKSKTFLSLAIFITFGLFYTHHLTSFIFLFVWMLLIPLFILTNYKDVEEVYKKVKPIIISPKAIATFVLGLIFFFFVFTPTYFKGGAVGTAVGTAEKSTRTGLTITNLKSTIGEGRLALGVLGLLLLFFGAKRKNFGYALVASWAIMLIIMASFPKILFINLPSNRIGNYLTFPFAILSAYGFFLLFGRKNDSQLMDGQDVRKTSIVPKTLFQIAYLAILAFIVSGGVADSADAFKTTDETSKMSQTFLVSEYLAKNTDDSDAIIKDHNYITADSWMKLFFMRGYKYPQSRGYFKRYEDATKNREQCTLIMISNPGGQEAADCFLMTKTDFVVVNPHYDSAQFEKLPNFDKIYASNDIAAYFRIAD